MRPQTIPRGIGKNTNNPNVALLLNVLEEEIIERKPWVYMKYCSRCERMLDKSHFYGQKKSRDGLQAYCKDCFKDAYDRSQGRDYE